MALSVPSSGFLTSIDEDGLRSVATGAEVYLLIDCHPGSSLVEGVPIGKAWSEHRQLDSDAIERLQRDVGKAIKVGYERTAAQDVGYGLRQLTDVANEALSPGINDPTTAIYALGHAAALLCQLASRDLGPVLLCDNDDDQLVRVVLKGPDLAEYLDLAITQPRRYGSADPQVMTRLFSLLEELTYHLADPTPIRAQLRRLWATVVSSDFDDTETQQLDQAARRVEHAMNDPVARSAR